MKHEKGMDWNITDVHAFICRMHNVTIEHIESLGFPLSRPDYHVAGSPRWRFETVLVWLEAFHAAILVIERARDPAGFNAWLAEVRKFMEGRRK